MTNEASIPNFPKTFEQFKSSQPQGIPIADRKHSGILLKRLLSFAKAKSSTKGKSRSGSNGRRMGRTKGKIASNNKLKFHHNSSTFR